MAANDTGAIFTNKLGFGNKPSLLVIKSPWAMYGEGKLLNKHTSCWLDRPQHWLEFSFQRGTK